MNPNPKPNTPAVELEKRIYSILQHQFLGPLEPTDVDVDEAYGGIMVLFYSELEQAVREARIDELTKLFPSYQRDGIGISYTVYNEWVRNRIAELQSTKEDKSK